MKRLTPRLCIQLHDLSQRLYSRCHKSATSSIGGPTFTNKLIIQESITKFNVEDSLLSIHCTHSIPRVAYKFQFPAFAVAMRAQSVCVPAVHKRQRRYVCLLANQLYSSAGNMFLSKVTIPTGMSFITTFNWGLTGNTRLSTNWRRI